MEAKLRRGPSRIGTLIFGAVLIAGLVFIGTSISHDLAELTLGSGVALRSVGFGAAGGVGF
jgi:hypothetical protein